MYRNAIAVCYTRREESHIRWSVFVKVHKHYKVIGTTISTRSCSYYLVSATRTQRSCSFARLFPPSANMGKSPADGWLAGTNPRNSFHTPVPLLLRAPACHRPPLKMRISFLLHSVLACSCMSLPRNKVGMSPFNGTITFRKNDLKRVSGAFGR